MELFGRDYESLERAGAKALFIGVYRRSAGSSKHKAKSAREALLREFQGISDAVIHQLESAAFKCMDGKLPEGC